MDRRNSMGTETVRIDDLSSYGIEVLSPISVDVSFLRCEHHKHVTYARIRCGRGGENPVYNCIDFSNKFHTVEGLKPETTDVREFAESAVAALLRELSACEKEIEKSRDDGFSGMNCKPYQLDWLKRRLRIVGPMAVTGTTHLDTKGDES